MAYAYPLKSRHVTSGYRTKSRPNHRALDYRARTGTPVYAAMDGTVATGSGHPNAGNWIEVRRGGDLAGYSHLSRRTVRPGEKVNAGDKIGESGATGRAFGAHLHFYVKENGRHVNPGPWLDQVNRPKPKSKSKSSGGMSTADWLSRAQIRKLQSGLRRKYPAYRWSVKVRRGSRITVDGIDGPQTQAWVREFQKRTGLKADGIAGPKTKAELSRRGINL